MNYTLHFISHTHWDREWYMSFEQHRMRLVELLDTLLEVFEKNEDFKSFHLDGQVILLEDYLEIRPQMLEKIRRYVSEGRLVIGPFYILQDEFLISGEANIRNLLYGLRIGKKYGPLCMMGYFPDAFGNISQMPQILKGFGIESAVFGRGINPIGFNYTLVENANCEKFNSELIWSSPDGSKVLGVLFANWYNNASEVPSDKIKAKEFISIIRHNAARVAATDQLLLMNGCDHQPVQVNLPEILKSLKEEFPGEMLVHSDFNTYINSIKPYKDSLKEVKGELTCQFTDGELTLVNTASSRIYLKQLNHKAQTLLEKWVEPLGVMAWIMGYEYSKDFIMKAWIYLMQNHPHDSICGCSIDDVHEEMVVRFKKSIAVSEELLKRQIAFILRKIDTTCTKESAVPIVVFNPLNWEASDLIEAIVDFEENSGVCPQSLCVIDCHGNQVPADFIEQGRTFTYTLPDDSFRKVNYVKRFLVKFEAEKLPSLGFATYWVCESENKASSTLKYGDNFAENDYLRLDICSDGSLKITRKEDGSTFESLNVFEDTADIGDEYKYVGIPGETAATTKNTKADISVFFAGSSSVTFRVRNVLSLPEKANKACKKRDNNLKDLVIESFVTLSEKGKRVDISTEFENNVSDHRIRALFCTGIESEYCYADGQFDVVERKIKPWEGWTNPSNCQRQQAFVEIHDGEKGLLIANVGLPEYEVLRDGFNTIALTLVRSVGELGDWGYFPTPGAQCQGRCRAQYSIIPFGGEHERTLAYKQAHQFNVLPLKAIQTQMHKGVLLSKMSFLDIKADGIFISALKKSEDRDAIILRLYNSTDDEKSLTIDLNGLFQKIFSTNMNEDRISELLVEGGQASINVPSKKIMTFELISKEGGRIG